MLPPRSIASFLVLRIVTCFWIPGVLYPRKIKTIIPVLYNRSNNRPTLYIRWFNISSALLWNQPYLLQSLRNPSAFLVLSYWPIKNICIAINFCDKDVHVHYVFMYFYCKDHKNDTLFSIYKSIVSVYYYSLLFICLSICATILSWIHANRCKRPGWNSFKAKYPFSWDATITRLGY